MDPSLINPEFDRSGITEDHFKFRNFPKLKLQDWKTDFSKKKIAKRITSSLETSPNSSSKTGKLIFQKIK